MTEYDFTTFPEREGKDSLAMDVIPFENVAVDEGFDKIPMWIADMSFLTCPTIVQSIRKRLEMPNFGYFRLSDEYYKAIIDWHAKVKGVTGLKPENIIYENGVLGGVASVVKTFTKPGDPVLVNSPTYVGFTHMFENTGRKAVHSALVRDEKGIWRLDYEDMEAKIRENKIRVAVFCSPHNPTGRVWERQELEKVLEVFERNDVYVISDEIWSDLIMPGNRQIPTQSVSDWAKTHVISFYAPTKTFSIAGFVGSYGVVYDENLKERILAVQKDTMYNEVNVLTMHALTGGYCEEGRNWLSQLLTVLESNIDYVCSYFETLDGVQVMRSQGTYMVYPDFSDYCRKHGVTIRELQLRGVRKGIIWQNGEEFLFPNTIRLNLAAPHDRIVEAVERMKKYVFID